MVALNDFIVADENIISKRTVAKLETDDSLLSKFITHKYIIYFLSDDNLLTNPCKL